MTTNQGCGVKNNSKHFHLALGFILFFGLQPTQINSVVYSGLIFKFVGLITYSTI